MTDNDTFGSGSYPAQPSNPPENRARTRLIAAACAAAAVLCAGLIVGAGAVLLYAFNPLGDE